MNDRYRREVLKMLRESNAIEGVYDKSSLIQAHRAWKLAMQYDTMTPSLIKHLHRVMMKNQPLAEHEKGAWRTVPVWIGGEKKSQPPLVIQQQVAEWCFRTNTVDRNFDPVTLHIEFEDIHPFVDGNGRMGRLLLNWHLVKRNKAPLLIYTEADKKTYYRLFSSYRKQEMRTLVQALDEHFFNPKP